MNWYPQGEHLKGVKKLPFEVIASGYNRQLASGPYWADLLIDVAGQAFVAQHDHLTSCTLNPHVIQRLLADGVEAGELDLKPGCSFNAERLDRVHACNSCALARRFLDQNDAWATRVIDGAKVYERMALSGNADAQVLLEIASAIRGDMAAGRTPAWGDYDQLLARVTRQHLEHNEPQRSIILSAARTLDDHYQGAYVDFARSSREMILGWLLTTETKSGCTRPLTEKLASKAKILPARFTFEAALRAERAKIAHAAEGGRQKRRQTDPDQRQEREATVARMEELINDGMSRTGAAKRANAEGYGKGWRTNDRWFVGHQRLHV